MKNEICVQCKYFRNFQQGTKHSSHHHSYLGVCIFIRKSKRYFFPLKEIDKMIRWCNRCKTFNRFAIAFRHKCPNFNKFMLIDKLGRL